jgi:hypothetical protein
VRIIGEKTPDGYEKVIKTSNLGAHITRALERKEIPK